MLVARLLSYIEPRRRVDAPDEAPHEPTPYRSPARRPHRSTDALPRPGDAWAIAVLRDGARGLAEALLGAAVAASWVGDGEDIPLPDDPMLRALHAELGGVKRQIYVLKRRSIQLAQAMAGSVARSPVARPESSGRRAYRLTVLAGAAVLAVGAVRGIRASALHRPHGLLLALMLLTAGLTLVFAARAARDPGPAARGYFRWIDIAMRSLGRDVRGGKIKSVPEVSLAVAVYGLDSLQLAPMFVAVELTEVSGGASASYTPSIGGGWGGTTCGGGSWCGGGGGGCGG